MLKMGVIGAGLVFQHAHLPVYQRREDVEVVCVAEPHAPYRARAREALPHAALYADYREALAHPEVQAFDICLPHALHESVVQEVFAAGKDVILEKPIALNRGEADRMLAAAKTAGRQFYVALNQRFYPAHQRVKKIIDEGEYGKPFFAIAHIFGDELARMDDPNHWKGTWEHSGGGALADSGTHAMDLLLWWFGRPRTIACQWGRFVVKAENKADDNALVTLQYENMLAEVAVSYSVQSDPWRESKWIYLTDASLQLHFDPECPLILGQRGQSPQALNVQKMDPWWTESVAAGLHHWLDCLRGCAQPAFGPEAARDTLEMIELAYQSAQEGRILPVPNRSENALATS